MRAVILLTLWSSVASAAPPLATTAELTGYQHTGRYDEVVRLCGAFQRRYPGRVRCVTFGRTPEGRPMLALVASDDGVLDPPAARKRSRPVVLAQGGIHAGEIDGKDAGFELLRELLDGRAVPGALRKVTFVFVPVFNVDGHERFAPNQRPNQRGPAEGGFRTTSVNLNLNRDYTKAETPEMAAMLRLFEAWDPTVYVDLHVTDGAKFEHDVAVLVAPDTEPGPLDDAARALSAALQARLTALGHLPLPFYPSFRVYDDPSSGFAREPATPRFSQAYAAARNRIGILVETHSWKDYPARVRATRDVLVALLERAVTDGPAWVAATAAADRSASALAGREVTLTWTVSERSHLIDFRGYRYTREPSTLSGGLWTRYDETTPEVWRLPMFDDRRPALVVRAPRVGYVVPPAHASFVGAKLAQHGIRYQVLKTAHPAASVSAFRATDVKLAPRSFEGHQLAQVQGAWASERRDLPAGSLLVPIDQPRARLLLHLLEPEAPDSLAAWGLFNAAFEQKEYMESYVAEEEARKLIARDRNLLAEFERRVAADAAFAKSPFERLQFFYRRHPAWDERVGLYPIYRVDALP